MDLQEAVRKSLERDLRAVQAGIACAEPGSPEATRLRVDEARIAQRARSLRPGLNGQPAV